MNRNHDWKTVKFMALTPPNLRDAVKPLTSTDLNPSPSAGDGEGIGAAIGSLLESGQEFAGDFINKEGYKDPKQWGILALIAAAFVAFFMIAKAAVEWLEEQINGIIPIILGVLALVGAVMIWKNWDRISGKGEDPGKIPEYRGGMPGIQTQSFNEPDNAVQKQNVALATPQELWDAREQKPNIRYSGDAKETSSLPLFQQVANIETKSKAPDLFS
jgi:hypothetical protein